MIAVVTIYYTTLNNNPPPPSQFLRDKILKKNYRGEMFIKKINEFELRSPRPSGCTSNAKTGYFMVRKKTPREICRSSRKLLLTAKYIAEGNAPCFSSPGPRQLKNLSKKMLRFKREL